MIAQHGLWISYHDCISRESQELLLRSLWASDHFAVTCPRDTPLRLTSCEHGVRFCEIDLYRYVFTGLLYFVDNVLNYRLGYDGNFQYVITYFRVMVIGAWLLSISQLVRIYVLKITPYRG